MMRHLTRVFLRGLAAVLPLAVTIYLLVWLARALESVLGGLVQFILPEGYYVPGMGFALGLIGILVLGAALKAWIFQRVWRWIEGLLDHVPLVRVIYSSMRELVNYLSGDTTDVAKKVVAVQIPGAPMKLVGLVTRDGVDEMGRNGGDLVAVFLPWSYQVGGFTVYMPRTEIEPIGMSVEDGLRFALTAGVSRVQRPPSQEEPASSDLE